MREVICDERREAIDLALARLRDARAGLASAAERCGASAELRCIDCKRSCCARHSRGGRCIRCYIHRDRGNRDKGARDA